MKISQLFFDRRAVTRKVDRSKRRALSRFGAFVRRTAKQSIRKRKSIAPPGSPPSSHTGLLKRFIFFGYSPRNDSVVIGPVRLSKKGQGDAPSLLEYGGLAKVNGKQAHYKPRPYMGPAFEKEKSKLPAIWRDSVK